MGKKVNVMLRDPIKGLFEMEYEEEAHGNLGIYAREYNSGGLVVHDDHGLTIAEFKGNEWVAYSVQKEDGE